MRRCVFLVCALLALRAVPAEARKPDPAMVDSLLSEAADTTIAYKNRVRIIKKAIDYDHTGRAMHALARLYISRGTITSRYDASLWLHRAMHREPKNATYQVTYAKLLWMLGRRGDAYTYTRRAIANNPNSVEALFLAGRYATWQMTRYLDGERVDDTYDDLGYTREATFNLETFGKQDRDAAIGYLTRALAINPEHRPSRLLLGLVYYESKMYDPLIHLFQEHLKRHPNDADAYFFVGLGYQAEGHLNPAYRAYVLGLSKMSELQQQFMESVFMVADKKTLGRKPNPEALPDAEALRKFWTGRDPLYLTPVNERLMEHCGRVAYANLRFGDPERNIPGWWTDRGQAYIRYGRPVARSVQPAEIRTGVDQPGWYQNYLAMLAQQGGSTYEYRPRAEIWKYDGFRLVFVNTDMEDTWRFGLSWVGNQPMGFSTLISRIPEYYKDPYGWQRYQAPHQVAQFREPDGKVRVEVYYALPGEEVTHRALKPGVQAVDMKQGLFLFDPSWKAVRRTVGKVDMMPWVVYDSVREGYLFASERMSLKPGMYHLAVEAQDQATHSVGTFRDSLKVRRFSRDSLAVSSLLLAREVVERDDRPFGRDRFMVLPNPLARCGRYGRAFFYFEVYNLSRDAFGSTHYQVTYQVRVLPEDGRKTQPKWTTAVSNESRGQRDWEPLYLALDMGGATPGKRAFRVIVEDLQNQEVATATTEFRVMW